VGAGVVVIVARREEVVGHGFVVGDCVASISDIVFGIGAENGGNAGMEHMKGIVRTLRTSHIAWRQGLEDAGLGV
jgi:hypothetical protein